MTIYREPHLQADVDRLGRSNDRLLDAVEEILRDGNTKKF